MGDDFNKAVQEALVKYSSYLDAKKIIYAGHSKGGYVALTAAGSPSLAQLNFRVGSIIVFAPAGYDSEYIKNLDPQIPLTLIWSDADTIVKKDILTEIYNKAPSKNKQLITAVSYPELKADHFFPLSKSYVFGGKNGISPLHYFGSWKWMIGAVRDLNNPQTLTDSYLYGTDALDTGINSLKHSALRSW